VQQEKKGLHKELAHWAVPNLVQQPELQQRQQVQPWQFK
jgi:hypothetical protein